MLNHTDAHKWRDFRDIYIYILYLTKEKEIMTRQGHKEAGPTQPKQSARDSKTLD